MQDRAQALSAALVRTEALLEAERARTAERVVEFERSRQAMRLEFEALGQKLLEEKGRSMLEQNHKSLEGLLTPVRERLKEFEEKFQTNADQDHRDRASLLERLRQLQETQTRLHEDAAALSRALTGESRAQGDWGELVLESLLASAGLTEGREFELQVDHRNEEGGHRRPDALIYLPPDRAIVIDAKCSLQAFVASTRAVSEEERESDLAAHVESLRTHVKLLAAKDYQTLLKARSLDFVFLFVPSEAAFHAALCRHPGLSEEALRQRVVVCSPTTVLATLQMVHHVWRSERQTLNAQRIAEEAGRMIDKLSAALDSFNEVGDRLNQAQHAFEAARGRLSTGKGNVVAIANRVLELGARANKPEKLQAVQKAMDAEAEEPAGPQKEPQAEQAQAQLQLEAGL
jgi:DNA recombination protein RmuC